MSILKLRIYSAVQDEEFIGRFRLAPVDAQARMLHGLQSFGVGLLEGFTGMQRCNLIAMCAVPMLGSAPLTATAARI